MSNYNARLVWISKPIDLPLHSKLLKSNQSTERMEIKKLKTASLADALKDMTIGETCVAPDGYQPKSVTKTCVELKEQGYLFQTSTRSGVQTITRLK